MTWLKKWDGPGEPLHFLRGLVFRAIAVKSWVERAENGRLLNDTLDLSELFHPDTFLNALRQQTARSVFSCYNGMALLLHCLILLLRIDAQA